jgi:nucleotide-binding universal stress UspA family protein
MKSPYRIVVGMDLEESGDVALRCALSIAARVSEVELHVVHVPGSPDGNLAILSRALEGGLEALRDRVLIVGGPARSEVPIRLHVRLGDVARTLEQVAVDYDADLVVVGTHGRTGAARLVLGSASAELTKIARLPVLVARDKDFQGVARTPSLDAPIPGPELHRAPYLTDVIHSGQRGAHISGLL